MLHITGEGEGGVRRDLIDHGKTNSKSHGVSRMKLRFILVLTICFMAADTCALADSYITQPNTGKRLYKWDGQYLMNPSTGKRLYKWDAQYIMNPSTGKRLYKWDGQYIMNPSTGKRLYKWDGQYVMNPSTGKRLFKYDGRYVSHPSTGKRLAEITGTVSVAVVIATATGML